MTRKFSEFAWIVIVFGIRSVAAEEFVVGQRVMPKTSVTATVAGQAVDLYVVGFPATITDVSGDAVECGGVMLNATGVVALEEAEKYYSQIIAANNGNVVWSFGFRGITRESLNDDDGAIRDHSEGIRLKPDSPFPYCNRAKIWMKKSDYKAAMLDYSKSIELGPELVLPRICRAMIWESGKDYTSARRDLDDAVRIAPLNADAYLSRAVLLSCCPDGKQRDGKQAVRDAAAACELTKWESPRALATLAMAHAESGDFVKAIECHERAVASIGPRATDLWVANLDLYKSQKPCRDLFQAVQFGN